MNRWYLFLTFVYCCLLFLLSSTANPVHFQPRFPGEDKLVHAGMYSGLALTVSMGLRRRGRPIHPLAQFLFPVVFAAVYGASDEFHQYFVPGRSADILDACADTTGAFLMQVFLCFGVWRLWRKPKRAATNA